MKNAFEDFRVVPLLMFYGWPFFHNLLVNNPFTNTLPKYCIHVNKAHTGGTISVEDSDWNQYLQWKCMYLKKYL